MKFTWERESEEGFCRITALPGPYDGVPQLASLVMDSVPRLVSNDRLAVACVLGFESYISGAVQFMSPISPEMATSITRLIAPTPVVVEPVNFEPKVLSYGKNTYILNIDDGFTTNLRWGGYGTSREFELNLSRMSESYLSHLSDERLDVPTNAGLNSPPGSTQDRRLIPYIAQAVLLSEDLDVGIIRLPAGIHRSGLLASVGALLQTCGMKLHYTT